jgi:Legionella pneumophila major outer membrane protein precursor
MHCKTRNFAAGILLAALAAHPVFGQSSSSPNGNPPGQQPGAGLYSSLPMLAPGQGMAQPAAAGGTTACVFCNQPDASHCNPYEDNNGPLLKCNPCLDSPAWAAPGWFCALEADLVGSHIKNHLTNEVGADTVHLPTAELDWTVSPRIELGYRFTEGAGELLLAYKFLVTTGTETLADFDAAGDPGNVHSRLDINAWDLDYGSREYSLWPDWDMKWRAGVRLAGLFFDSAATSPLLDQHVANYYFGAGPHVGLDLRRFLKGTGLELFSRLESAFLMGQGHQSFTEVVTPVGGAPVSGATPLSDPLVVPWLGVQAGLGWVPPGFDQLTISAGYTLEVWWDMADIAGSRGDITNQGVFFRAEIRY